MLLHGFYVAPEEFRNGVYAQGTSDGLQQSAAGCFGGGENAEVAEINGAMPAWWHMPNSHPKAGQQELSPETLCDVTAFTVVRNLRTNKWLV